MKNIFSEYLTPRTPRVLGRKKPLSLADMSQNINTEFKGRKSFIFLDLYIERERIQNYCTWNCWKLFSRFSIGSLILSSFLVWLEGSFWKRRVSSLPLNFLVPTEVWGATEQVWREASSLTVKVKVTQSCLTLCDPMDYTIHGIL